MQRKNIFWIFTSVVIALLVVVLFRQGYKTYYIQSIQGAKETEKRPSLSTEANRIFLENVIKADNINTDLEIVTGTIFESSDDSKRNEQTLIATLIVYNHSGESIKFSNQGFNLEVFQFDQNELHWNQIDLLKTPLSEEKVIPAGLETMDFGVMNFWDLSKEDIQKLEENSSIRIYIQGKGLESGNTYGSYLDIFVP